MDEPQIRTVRWRWARNGALFGIVIVLADLMLEWRGRRYYPWINAETIAFNIGQMIAIIGIPALIGLGLGVIRDPRTKRG